MIHRLVPALLAALLAAPAALASPFYKDLGHPGVCRNDRYFVDLPIWTAADRLPVDFQAQLQRRLTQALRQHLAWVCEDPAICDRYAARVRERIFADVRPVLPERRDDAARADGHRRFWRIAFYAAPFPVDELGRATGQKRAFVDRITRLEVPASAACTIVGTLRTATEASSGLVVGREVFAGRSCLAGQLGAAHHADEAMRTWHLDRLAVVPPGPAGAVIALLDTGVEADLQRELGLRAMPGPLDLLPRERLDDGTPVPEPAGLPDPHGAAMALLLRQIAPSAPIADHPVLGAEGRATVDRVAQSLDRVAFESRRDPVVVNLSLGWPPELEQGRVLRGPRSLAGAGCAVDEDPVGESVRYALRMAQLRDQGRLRQSGPTLVVAASGNRAPLLPDPGEAYAGLFDSHPAYDACEAAGPDDLFYPAAWDGRVSCTERREAGPPLVLAVGATDARDLPAALAPPVPSPPWWPPASTYVSAAGADRSPPPACGAATSPRCRPRSRAAPSRPPWSAQPPFGSTARWAPPAWRPRRRRWRACCT
ncbi:MAG: S8/S53 family peptidase [bacterium]